jgi:hypothetical protein
MLRTFAFAVAFHTWFAVPLSAADEWGDLAVRFVFDGEPPEPRQLVVDKDQAFCKQAIFAESLVVDSKDRGIANLVIGLAPAGGAVVPVHADYEKTAKESVSLTAKSCRFEPHVVLARSTQSLKLGNSDPIGYCVRGQLQHNNPFSFICPADKDQTVVFERAERLPAPIDCAIHAWMRAWVFVHDNPYAAKSDSSGKLALANVPQGKWTFRLWHERAGYVRSVHLGGADVDWPRAGLAIEIKPGRNDLGDVLVKPAAFNEQE